MYSGFNPRSAMGRAAGSVQGPKNGAQSEGNPSSLDAMTLGLFYDNGYGSSIAHYVTEL